MNEQSEVAGKPRWAQSRFKVRLVLGAFMAVPIYLFFAFFFLIFTDGRIFITPTIYGAGLVFAVGLSIFLFRALPGSEENVLFSMFVVFPVVLMVMFPIAALVPARLLHMLLPQKEVVEVLHFERLSGCGRRSSIMRGVEFEEAFGVFNNQSCRALPQQLLGQLRKGDAMHWLIRRSAVGFSVERLERVTRDRQLVFGVPQ